jgi:hypothetical protein
MPGQPWADVDRPANGWPQDKEKSRAITPTVALTAAKVVEPSDFDAIHFQAT